MNFQEIQKKPQHCSKAFGNHLEKIKRWHTGESGSLKKKEKKRVLCPLWNTGFSMRKYVSY